MHSSPSGRVALPYLRSWRNRRYLTIRGLAKASGVGTRTINEIELGRRQANFATVGRLAGALGLTSEQLARVNPEQEPPSSTASA
jgi:transcriptional regulator with XRE-family HTH domain